MKIHIDIPLEQKNFNTKKRIFAPNILEKDFADACLKEIKELDLPLMNHPNSKNPYEVVNENFAWRFHKTNQIDKYGKNFSFAGPVGSFGSNWSSSEAFFPEILESQLRLSVADKITPIWYHFSGIA